MSLLPNRDDQIEQLRRERDALGAQVEAMRDQCAQICRDAYAPFAADGDWSGAGEGERTAFHLERQIRALPIPADAAQYVRKLEDVARTLATSQQIVQMADRGYQYCVLCDGFEGVDLPEFQHDADCPVAQARHILAASTESPTPTAPPSSPSTGSAPLH